MLKRIIIVVFILITGVALGQGGTTSPYSFYGIGIQKFKGTAENRAMGGIGVFSDSIHLSIQNPAGLADLRLINYTVGASHKYLTQKSEVESQKSTATSLDYIAVGIPMGKLVGSFGLMPYSAVGYKLQSTDDNTVTQSSGDGGVNRAFITFAYKITPKLNVGIESNYNFGSIENEVFSIQDDLELGSRVINRSEFRGFTFNFGASYKTMVSDKLELSTAMSFSPGTNVQSDNTRTTSTIAVLPSGFLAEAQSLEFDDPNTDFTFPSQFTIGAGIGVPKHWSLGLEYTGQKTSNFKNRHIELDNSLENVMFVDASKLKLGGYFIPNYNIIGSYWKRVSYRAGVHFENTGLNIEGEDINEFGISFGVGLPTGRLFSNVNIGFEAGRRGTTNAGLIQENFLNTFLSLSLNDKWFEKRYYD
jgi:long-subunit fatty acid transport protein